MPGLISRNFVIKDSLRAYILRERAKREEEEAQTSAREKQVKEREQKAKLDSLTLEQTKEKILQQEKVLADLEQEKHTLFNQLKKVLNKESEQRRRIMLSSEMVKVEPPPQMDQSFLASPVAANRSAVIYGPPPIVRPTAAVPSVPPPLMGVKRSRSPSPPNRNVMPPSTFNSPSAYQSSVRMPLDSMKKSPVIASVFSNFKPADQQSFGSPESRLPHPLAMPKPFSPGVAGIPVLTSPRQMGSISSGYAVQKPPGLVHPPVRPGFAANPKLP